MNWLKGMSFDVTKKPYENELNVCRLVANTIKHGEGASRRQLSAAAPHLLSGADGSAIPPIDQKADDLWISPTDFRQFSDAMDRCWIDMPDQLILSP